MTCCCTTWRRRGVAVVAGLRRGSGGQLLADDGERGGDRAAEGRVRRRRDSYGAEGEERGKGAEGRKEKE